MEDFLFPASKVVVQTRKNKAETPLDPVVPVCASSASVNAAFELLVALCVNCVANMKLVVDTLREMYYSGRYYSTGILKIEYGLHHCGIICCRKKPKSYVISIIYFCIFESKVIISFY